MVGSGIVQQSLTPEGRHKEWRKRDTERTGRREEQAAGCLGARLGARFRATWIFGVVAAHRPISSVDCLTVTSLALQLSLESASPPADGPAVGEDERF